MKEQLAAVAEFIKKHNFKKPQPLEDRFYDEDLDAIGTATRILSKHLKDVDAQLVLEEASEWCAALALADKNAMCDALGDLLYVVLGRAIQFDIPIERVFERVHASNMTKKVSGEYRCSDKGEEYQPPNFTDLL